MTPNQQDIEKSSEFVSLFLSLTRGLAKLVTSRNNRSRLSSSCLLDPRKFRTKSAFAGVCSDFFFFSQRFHSCFECFSSPYKLRLGRSLFGTLSLFSSLFVFHRPSRLADFRWGKRKRKMRGRGVVGVSSLRCSPLLLLFRSLFLTLSQSAFSSFDKDRQKSPRTRPPSTT